MFKTLILFAVLLSTCFGFSQSDSNNSKEVKFPPCELVLAHAIENLDHLPKDNLSLGLAKKAEGYFLTVIKFNERSDWNILRYIPVWLKETGELVVPELGEYEGEIASKYDVETHFSQISRSFSSYDFYKYTGYPNCDADIIELLGSKKKPSLYEYELLARAHSNLGQRYFHPVVGGIPPAFAKELSLTNYEKISSSRIKKASKHIKKSLEYWDRIEKTDPTYEPHIISNIRVKAANEHMHFWSLFMSVQEPELARKLMNEANYAPYDLDVAKRMLDNCEENGFLFTNGDSDTYTIWYIQEKLGYRADVVVLNASLMQTDWYLSMCKARGNYQTNLKSEDYERFRNFVVVSYPEGEASIESAIKDSLLLVDEKSFEDGYVLVAEDLTIDLGRETESSLGTGRYLYMWQMAALDIIISNPDRKFYTTQARTIWGDLGLKNYGIDCGSLSQLATGEISQATSDERNSYLKFENQLNNMDLNQIATSFLTRFEYAYLLDNLTNSAYLFDDDFEKAAIKLVEEINLDIVISAEDPNIVLSTVLFLDKMNSEKANLLREKYRKEAREIIKSIEENGANYLENHRSLGEIYSIYSGKTYYRKSVLDSHEESQADLVLLEELKEKLYTIKLNIGRAERYHTFDYLNFFLSIIDDL